MGERHVPGVRPQASNSEKANRESTYLSNVEKKLGRKLALAVTTYIYMLYNDSTKIHKRPARMYNGNFTIGRQLKS